MTLTSHPVPAVSRPTGRRTLVVPGLLAAVAASAVTTAAAAAARAAGVDFELPDGGGESIPASGFAVATFVLSVLGLGLALAIRQWAARPAATWVRAASALTAVSLVPPFLVEANAATAITLVALHLLAALVVVPVVASRLPDHR